jgi:hypothetical protein
MPTAEELADALRRTKPGPLGMIRKAQKEMTEDELLRAVLDLAKLYGWRSLHIRPARTDKGWRSPVQGDGKGFPDLLLLKEDGGRMIAAELKSDKGRLTKDQEEWLEAFYWCDAQREVWRPADWNDGTILAELSGSPRSPGEMK